VKTLVTGGAGFIGSHVVDLLVKNGHPVTVLDNLDEQVHGREASRPRYLESHLACGAVRFIRGDVNDRAAVGQALEGNEVLVHLAAVVGVGQSMYRPHYYVANNSGGTGLLLDVIAASAVKPQKMVVASSMSLYGEGSYRCPQCGGGKPKVRGHDQLSSGQWEVKCADCDSELEPLPTAETKPPEITSVYAATKKHQEDLFVVFGRAYRIPTVALRLFNVFGPRQSLSNPYTGVAAIFLSRLLNGQSPLIFEDGRQSRDFVDVRDVARCFVLAVEREYAGAHVLNVGTGRSTTVAAVAKSLAEELDLPIAARLLNRFRAGDIRHCFSDSSKAKEILGFQAEFMFGNGLRPLIEWCRDERPVDRVDASLTELESMGLVE
jgi:dTDP-L-rhamnose 4-epimerase